MKLQLNEKLWFGKYKNERLIDIIDSNYKYINKLHDEYNVELSDEAYSYYQYRKQSKSNSKIRIDNNTW